MSRADVSDEFPRSTIFGGDGFQTGVNTLEVSLYSVFSISACYEGKGVLLILFVTVFQITNHGVPKELRDSVFKAAETFFKLPLEEKKKLRVPVLKNRGYEVIGSQVSNLNFMREISFL